MIEFIALALATPAPDKPHAHQIEVIAQRLDTWRARVKNRKGVLSCDITASTGDTEIDQIGCDALVGCTLAIKPQLDATAALDLPRKERDSRLTALMEAQGPCIIERREIAIDALAQKRADAL